ncbi:MULTISPECIES: DNA repair protein RadC [unclassified Paenibacillus]|uniref:RadC family protein n=1 Tax=unclassified Paenibacillus TaxID=185978 RepID=UPI0009566D82|nr:MULTISPECIES: DNA repair protein RadC [unclassified Paenibacillus]ASS66331.1 JAB domain-containing protein [Paenibacillus sp. RUD330]SIQ07540.1 DNA repair protein RadC [Paenibacillus sp. RU4X]SIQ27598.1 DNA repair protein RadC [Paenibacillus sp. RU4T]
MPVPSKRLSLRELPSEERPRERMIKYGAEALSHAELLAILLRTGTASETAVHLASRILAQSGSLRGLVDMGTTELTRIKGIGPAKALQIRAGIELGRRLSQSRRGEAAVVRRPQDAADYLMEDLRYHKVEHFVCLFLNTKNHIIARETISVGTLNASLVHPREVFRSAIRHGAASIVCAHNHPSGDPSPSPEDAALTRRLAEAGELVGIDVLDHIVIGDGVFISLKEQGLL